MPPLHDPIPYDRVAELIGTAEPSRQSTVLHDAGGLTRRRRRVPTPGKRSRSMPAETSCSRAIGRLIAGRKSSHRGRTGLARRPAFSFLALTRLCVSVGALSKSSMGHTRIV
jgi:hypothetical protein